jgi:hypothetical protein
MVSKFTIPKIQTYPIEIDYELGAIEIVPSKF